MILFKYEHAARNWAYHQRKWFNKRTEVIRLKSETPEGARWGVKEMREEPATGCDYGIGG